MERKVDLSVLKQPGTYPTLEEKATLELATAIHRAESTDVAVPWSAQERAQKFANEHDLADVLDEMFRLQAMDLNPVVEPDEEA